MNYVTDRQHLHIEFGVEEGVRRLEWLHNQKGTRT